MTTPTSSVTSARSRVAQQVRQGGREFAGLLTSTVVFHAARIGIALWAAAALGPERFGRWNLLAVLVGYASHAHLADERSLDARDSVVIDMVAQARRSAPPPARRPLSRAPLEPGG